MASFSNSNAVKVRQWKKLTVTSGATTCFQRFQQRCYQRIFSRVMYKMSMKLDSFGNVCPTRRCITVVTNVMEASVLKTASPYFFAANQDALHKILVFVIGKSERPRCFKNYKVLLCEYKVQSNSWMTGEHFINANLGLTTQTSSICKTLSMPWMYEIFKGEVEEWAEAEDTRFIF